MWETCFFCGKKRKWKRKSTPPRVCRKCGGHFFEREFNILQAFIEATDIMARGIDEIVRAFRKVCNKGAGHDNTS